jgi:hypothetical protein
MLQTFDTHSLSQPDTVLLGVKSSAFVRTSFANELSFAAICGLHLAHPSKSRIDGTHLITLDFEVDDEAPAGTSLRRTFSLIAGEVAPISKVIQRRLHVTNDAALIHALKNPRPLGSDVNGRFDVEYSILIFTRWKSKAKNLRSEAVQLQCHGFWIERMAKGTERAYEAIVADWIPFLQRSLAAPSLQSFRHIFDAKVDEATRSYDFGVKDEQKWKLPARTSAEYEGKKERMFKDIESHRNMQRSLMSMRLDQPPPFRTYHSPTHHPDQMLMQVWYTAGMMGMLMATTRDDPTAAPKYAVPMFTDGRSGARIPLKDGQDVMDAMRKMGGRQK